MKITVEKKITFDPEVEGTDPIIAYESAVESISADLSTVQKMVDVGILNQDKMSREKLTVAISDYLKSLEEE